MIPASMSTKKSGQVTGRPGKIFIPAQGQIDNQKKKNSRR
jgi:hypothetical protein